MLNQLHEYPDADFGMRLFGETVAAKNCFDAIIGSRFKLDQALPIDGRYECVSVGAKPLGGDIYEMEYTFRLPDEKP